MLDGPVALEVQSASRDPDLGLMEGKVVMMNPFAQAIRHSEQMSSYPLWVARHSVGVRFAEASQLTSALACHRPRRAVQPSLQFAWNELSGQAIRDPAKLVCLPPRMIRPPARYR